MALPVAIGTCRIVGRFIRTLVDGADSDREPDAIPIQGLTISITASVSLVRHVDGAIPTLIVVNPISCTTNANGMLVGPDGLEGIEVVASNDADLEPSGWTYTAVITGSGVSFSVSFVAPVDGVLDLATIVPVPADPGAELLDWQQAVLAAQAARDAAIAAAAGGGGGGGGGVTVSAHPTFTGVAILGVGGLVAPAVTVQPSAQSTIAGTNVSMTAAASGNPVPTVQWQRSTDAGTSWANVSGATANTLTITAPPIGANGYRYRAVFTNSQGTATSSAAILTVSAAGAAPAFTQHPASQSIEDNGTAVFSVSATGTPAPSWQWQYNDGGGWLTYTGETASTIVVENVPLSSTGRQFRCVATNTAGVTNSNAATLTVTPALAAPVITTQPTNYNGTAGSNANFTAAASGNPTPTIQWQLDDNEGGGYVNGNVGIGAQTNTFTPFLTALSNGWKVRCTFTNSQGSATTTVATISLTAAPPAFSTHPANASRTAGTSVSFTASSQAFPSSITRQWQVSTDGGTAWNDIAGATASTYTFTTASGDNNKRYRVRHTNSSGSTNSNAAILTVT